MLYRREVADSRREREGNTVTARHSAVEMEVKKIRRKNSWLEGGGSFALSIIWEGRRERERKEERKDG